MDVADPKSVEQSALEILREVYDPEIPVSVVELGLIYGCRVTQLPGGGHRISVRMTMTAPGCGMSDLIKREIEQRLGQLPGVKEVIVEIVFDPPWEPSMMSETARLQLGLF
jgi:metal-sulfur cluster biosynthetic enzyme